MLSFSPFLCFLLYCVGCKYIHVCMYITLFIHTCIVIYNTYTQTRKHISVRYCIVCAYGNWSTRGSNPQADPWKDVKPLSPAERYIYIYISKTYAVSCRSYLLLRKYAHVDHRLPALLHITMGRVALCQCSLPQLRGESLIHHCHFAETMS